VSKTEPKVALYDCRGNLADPGEGVFVHLNDYEALAAELEKEKQEHAKTLSLANDRDVAAQKRVQELEDDVREGVEAQVRYVAENTRLRELDWEL